MPVERGRRDVPHEESPIIAGVLTRLDMFQLYEGRAHIASKGIWLRGPVQIARPARIDMEMVFGGLVIGKNLREPVGYTCAAQAFLLRTYSHATPLFGANRNAAMKRAVQVSTIEAPEATLT